MTIFSTGSPAQLFHSKDEAARSLVGIVTSGRRHGFRDRPPDPTPTAAADERRPAEVRRQDRRGQTDRHLSSG